MTYFQKLSQSSQSIMVLTLIHHAYGALIYEESFRLHVAYFAIPVIVILWFTSRLYQKNPSEKYGIIAFRMFMFFTLFISTGMIGLYEGGYNHLLKNVLYYGGTNPETLTRLFPPPMYEMPNDLLFEVTGVFQFILAIYALFCLVIFRKEKRG